MDMVDDRDVLVAQLRAARNSLEAACIAVDTSLLLMTGVHGSGTSAPGPDEPGIQTQVECKHPDMEDASVMGQPPRSHCRACHSFVYPDGRIESDD